MRIQVSLELPEAEVLDASDQLVRLLDEDADASTGPPLRHLLVALDDAITDAFSGRRPRWQQHVAHMLHPPAIRRSRQHAATVTRMRDARRLRARNHRDVVRGGTGM